MRKFSLEGARAIWRTLLLRERKLIVYGGLLLALALIAQVLWSVHMERARLRLQVAHARQQVVEPTSMRQKLQRLYAIPESRVNIEGEALDLALRTSINNRFPDLDLRLSGLRRVQVHGEVAFDDWLGWLAEVRTNFLLRIRHCEIDSTGKPGRVRVVAELESAHSDR